MDCNDPLDEDCIHAFYELEKHEYYLCETDQCLYCEREILVRVLIKMIVERM